MVRRTGDRGAPAGTWRRAWVRVRDGVLSIGHRRGAPSDPDPFAVLATQQALSRLEEEIAELLRAEPRPYALAFHLTAATWAYDRTLEDACRLAGVPAEPVNGPVSRLLAETELRSRGWRW